MECTDRHDVWPRMLSAYGVMQDFAETVDFRQRQSISCTFQLSPVKLLTSLKSVHHGSAVILPVEDFQITIRDR